MDSLRINKIVADNGLPKFRKGQLTKAFFSEAVDSFNEITTFSKDLREKLTEQENVLTVTLHKLYSSTAKNAHKALLKLEDGKLIETVLLNPKPGLWTTCISSQIGCALACDFCATGTMGWIRNLTSEEITDQVLFWRFFMKQELKDIQLNNVVYMGMGEPLHNKKEVFKSLDELMNPDTFNMGARHLSVSTVGLLPAMKELTDKYPQVNLAISFHAPNDEIRLGMMPINKPYPIDKLLEGIAYHLDKTNRKIFIEYILLDGKNDSEANAFELGRKLKTLGKKHLIHINLIVYNKTDKDLEATSRDQAQLFKRKIEEQGLSITIRKNLGRDIHGACGQLALKEPNSVKATRSSIEEILK